MQFKKLLISFLFFSSLLTADNDIKSLLDDFTEIATKTKLNIDYQPSVVSVLHADKLKKIGIKNLHEAIGLLPGIETSILHTGWKQVIFRGAYNPDTFIFDKYKLYIDGVDIGSDLYSTSYYYLDFPVELISRIEILRGSASTIYGAGAFSGAINVITKSSKKNSQDKIFASTGSYGYYKGGFVKHLKMNDWYISLDTYYQADNKTIDADHSFVSTNEGAYQRTEYRSLENFKDFSIGLIAQNKDFQLTTRYKSEITDNFYGMNENLEPVTGGYQHNQSAIIDLKYTFPINKNVNLHTKLGMNFYSFTFDTTLYNNHSLINTKIQYNPTYEQLSSYIDVNLDGKFLTKHDWVFGATMQKVETTKNEFGTTWRPFADTGPQVISSEIVYLDGKYGFTKNDINQIMKSIYFQDIYSINNNFDIAINARLDDYSLFEEMYSYRLSSIYRLNDNNIFKAIYGRSFRAPSYVEAFQAIQDGFKEGNPNLKSERMDTYEIAYTYKNNSVVLRANAFYSVIDNVIDVVENHAESFDYANHQKRTAKGIEAEFKYMFQNNVELMMNFSYLKTQFYSPDYYNPVEYQSPEISEVLSKGYLLYPLNNNISLNTAWYYSGPKNPYSRNNSSTGITIDETLIVDETIAYDIDSSSLITLSVKNLFDSSIIYPSFRQNNAGIKREGRNWLLTYEKLF